MKRSLRDPGFLAISFRVSDAEADQIRLDAIRQGLTVSAYIRTKLLPDYAPPPPQSPTQLVNHFSKRDPLLQKPRVADLCFLCQMVGFQYGCQDCSALKKQRLDTIRQEQKSASTTQQVRQHLADKLAIQPPLLPTPPNHTKITKTTTPPTP